MRRSLGWLVAATALVVLCVSLGTALAHHGGSRLEPTAAPSPRPTPATTSVQIPPPTTATANPESWAAISDEATSEADYLAGLSDPNRSDLEPWLARTLAERASAVVRADLSGVGREEFPRYWSGPAPAADPGPCCSQITIDAAGAASAPGHPSLARVAVVWSASRGAMHLVHRTTVVYFQRTSGSWEPRRPWDLDG
jgi:hypothetical protein